MKYCKQCGTQKKDEAVFCPSCGTKAEETDSIGVWRSLDEQKNGKHVNPITDNEVVQNLMKKIPDNAKDQMKELSGKAKEGVSQLAEKAREYGGKLTEKAEDFTQNVSQTVRDIPRPDISNQNENTETIRTPHKANRKLLISVLVILVLVIGIGGIYYLSRFTLVGDLFATASLGGVTIGPGTMEYSRNGNDQFTIHAFNVLYLFTPDRRYLQCGWRNMDIRRRWFSYEQK